MLLAYSSKRDLSHCMGWRVAIGHDCVAGSYVFGARGHVLPFSLVASYCRSHDAGVIK